MSLEDIMLSEISRMQKDKYRMISLMCNLNEMKWSKNKHVDTEIRVKIIRGEGWEWGVS